MLAHMLRHTVYRALRRLPFLVNPREPVLPLLGLKTTKKKKATGNNR